jgi:hypothetical protein
LSARTEEAWMHAFKKSYLTKIRMVVAKTPTLLKFRIFNQITNAPYCDCFNPEEEWVVTSTHGMVPKLVVRHCLYINVHKSFMMSGIVTSKGFAA